MRAEVLSWCRTESLIPPGSRVVCAVSGGADSVAMLHCLMSLRGELSIAVSAAHYNHRLRGAESDRDEAFVRALCRDWDVPLTVGSGDVAARAAQTGESVEEAARAMRYAFFASLPGLVATAHTADDNLETVLLNLLRGTGLRGLCGIPPRRGAIIRPLLCLTRDEVAAYSRENGLRHVEDSTNGSGRYLRNRLRHQVLPLLQAENPSVSETVLRSCLLLRQDEEFLNSLARSALESAAVPGGWSCGSLRKQPDAVRTRAVHLLLRQISAPKLSERHIAAVDRLILEGGPSARCILPGGFTAARRYDCLTLQKTAPPPAFAPVPLGPDGTADLPGLGLRIVCRQVASLEPFENTASRFACRAGACLCARPRLPGDTLRLPAGSRTLKRIFIDRKIPAAERGLLPVIADEAGVLGVYGVGVNPGRRALPGEAAVIIQIEKKEDS